MRLINPLLILACCALPLHADEAAPDLQQLSYNNPGLVVDLGVGLWAWPMPVDYDGDGDYDLLVACPDKPSNGVYYFENPGKNAKEKMPVFKAGKRIGPAGHNMQVSYVDGKPRILRQGTEYKDFIKNGFEKAEKIYPQANIHENGVRANMWRYVDWEGDGDQDLLVGVGDWSDYGWDHAYDENGVWKNGPLHGYVYLIENGPEGYGEPRKIKTGEPVVTLQSLKDENGTEVDLKTTAEFRALARQYADKGVEIDVYGWPSPNYADFDGDGDMDLLCGEFLDGFTYFENEGTREVPIFAEGSKMVGSDGKPLVMDLQMITPVAIDWDRDGDMDLICGDEDGRVALIEMLDPEGASGPVFAQPVYFQQEADTLKFGALATPFAYDWDKDGDEDILCGNTAGYIGFFENLGMEGDTPQWARVKYLEDQDGVIRILAGPNGSIQGPCEAKWGYTTLSASEVLENGVSRQVLLVNSIWGKLETWSRTDNGKLTRHTPKFDSSAEAPSWAWWSQVGTEAVTQWRTTPLQVNWPYQWVSGVLVLDNEGYLAVHDGENFQRPFVDEDLQPIQLNQRTAGRSGRFKLADVDWDGDGLVDLLVNSENASWYRNCGTQDGKIVLKKVGNLANRKVSGHTSSPSVCDFDQDGKPDLLVGAEDGRIYYAHRNECITYGADAIAAQEPAESKKPRQPGLVSEEFIYTKAPFPQCHASTIIENSRGLVAAWFGGTHEKNPDVGIWVSYNDGAGWSNPIEVANGIQYEGHRHPTWNPVLFQTPGDQETLLFFKVGPDPRTWWGEMMVSYDRGRTFRDRTRLPEGIDGPVKNKPVLLSNGTLLCPSSTEYDGWRVHFELTDDFGKTWKRVGPINDASQFNAIQPTLLQHPGGKLQILCRTQEGRVVSSFSSDNGLHWSKLEAINLPNPNAGFDAVTLRDGRHVLVYNHTLRDAGEWRGRSQLNVAVSYDGLDWKSAVVLEQEAKSEFSYPAVIQTADGMVHTTYTWKRQRIKHAVLDPNAFVLKDFPPIPKPEKKAEPKPEKKPEPKAKEEVKPKEEPKPKVEEKPAEDKPASDKPKS